MVNLKSILSGEKKDENKYFWSLVIEPGWAQAGIWTIINGKAEVASISPSTAWQTDEELISACDTALSAAVQELPDDAGEPSETVFGVPSSWVTEGQIKKEYLEKLKKVCAELSLEPTGFVALPEAIAHIVKSEEGSPFSGVAIGISEEEIEVSVFRLGNLIGTSQVARSVSAFDDLVEGLTRFGGDDPLPSRFIIYDGKEAELEDVRQSLLKGRWEDVEKIKFLHTPKVEIFTPDKKVLAVSLGGASELDDVTKVERTKSEGEEIEERPKEEVENLDSPKEAVSAEDVGFVIGQDVATSKEEITQPISAEQVQQTIPQSQGPTISQEGRSKIDGLKKNKAFDNLGRLKLTFTSIFHGGLSRIKLPDMGGKKTFTFGGIFFLLILIGGFLAWWFLPKATVTIYVSPKKLEEDALVIVSTSARSVNLSESLIPGSLEKTSESGDKTASTTGTQTVGERAKGEVTIYRVGSQISLDAGTTLSGPGGLDFTLDDDATVASGSATSPGTTKTSVTAKNIGSQYNLDSGATFSVGNYGAEVEAKNESAFGGGSSREISAVSEEDQDNLLGDLEEELVAKAKQDFKNTIPSDKVFIEGSTTTEVVSKDFSGKVGDEADTLKLSLTIEVTGLVVSKEDLFNLSKEILKNKTPSGYVLRENQIEASFDLEEENDGEYQLDGSIKANLLPEINPDTIAKEIAGKYSPLAEQYLNTIPGFSRAVIDVRPPLPGKLGSLPRSEKRISVEVSAER